MSQKNLLEQLKSMTVVVADTGDINSIEKFRPRDTTTNPSLITTAASMPAYAKLVEDALVWARNASKDGSTDAIVKHAIENSIRKVDCTVTWQQGNIPQEFTLQTFWFHFFVDARVYERRLLDPR